MILCGFDLKNVLAEVMQWTYWSCWLWFYVQSNFSRLNCLSSDMLNFLSGNVVLINILKNL